MEEFLPYFSTNQDRLEGWWSDDCPVEFSYEEFQNVKKPSSTLFEQKIKSVDGQQYAQIKDQESQIIIQIYQIPDIYITQIEIDGPKSNRDQIQITQQYLIYIRDQSMYYYNFKQHKGFSFMFQKAYYLSLCYSQNELYIIIESGFRRIKLYRIHENFEMKFVKEVNWYNNYYLYGSIELDQHNLGFLVKDFDKIHLISNQTLKQVCSFKKLKIDDTYNLLKWYIMKNILFLQVEKEKYKIMTQLRNGKIIRKIKCSGAAMELFSHFLIVSKPLNDLQNSINIYDYIKGSFMAEITYSTYEFFKPAYMQNSKFIIPMEMYEIEWNIKEKYLIK